MTLEIERITGRVEAHVHGVEVTEPLEGLSVDAIGDALPAHEVLFFVDPPLLTREQRRSLTVSGYDTRRVMKWTTLGVAAGTRQISARQAASRKQLETP